MRGPIRGTPFENALIKYSNDRFSGGIKEVIDHFLDAFHTAQRMAQQYDYLFPIYYRVATLRAEGAAQITPSWPVCLGSGPGQQLTGEQHYLEEARRAIRFWIPFPQNASSTSPRNLPTVHSRLRN